MSIYTKFLFLISFLSFLFPLLQPQDENSAPNGTENGTPGTDDLVKKKKLTLSFDEYKTISNMIILHMRQEETRMEVEAVDSDGLKRSDIIGWYLEQIAETIESEEELIEKKTLVEKVIDRLVYHDQVIIPLRTAPGFRSAAGAESEEAASGSENDPVLVVHPNYIVETWELIIFYVFF